MISLILFLTLQHRLILYTDLTYGALVNYSPRGYSALAQQSQEICGRVKAGNARMIVNTFKSLDANFLKEFLSKETTLVPVPRSAPLIGDAMWPGKLIADLLINYGYGKEVYPCLVRTKAIKKSSLSFDSGTRPLVTEHYESIGVSRDLRPDPIKITLVDDVITMGRTTYACAQRLKEEFTNAEIKVFTILRTQQKDIDKVFGLFTGTITGYPSGKTWKNDNE